MIPFNPNNCCIVTKAMVSGETEGQNGYVPYSRNEAKIVGQKNSSPEAKLGTKFPAAR